MPRRKVRRTDRRPQRAKDLPDRRGSAHTDAFRCVGCRLDVPLSAPGTAHRNHCPHCLTSLHVDRRIPGDRDADCRGRMEAMGLSVRPDGEWMLIHHCLECGELSVNRIAGDDNPLALLRMAVRPLSDSRVPVRVLLTL
ncbi:RNHCP domain-containing protein [Streptoalloteichus tenebrarius]|uniref:RNHCP domain-containing protein n=1 Tax=Streptoalloteichus tenebrarius (strain ATCC 17920 / DSM 40477 / JCM 4838 / CBS 697.72 / NBRC 16177 / NCIMB 11028 / NRRL B-12390 / A12253. 1 / ISP 5477) TaxID=1933 RepID=A0ABT1HRH9_STRSD|nr:RNHCP domain-containing protein [Streptoalloteichus tenebrarius]MCP2258129.1 RNHCP domain-containing protein [Streptoalloteichus tenebrarius]BFF04645.1 RNHCP domain-containing protein [Streptoalloteichus tenebrarius]